MADSIPAPQCERPSVLGTLDELLHAPLSGVTRAQTGESITVWAARALVGTVGCLACYGAASGFFQGGWQIVIAAAKAPVILLATALLCVPSLYVFGLLAGAALTRQRLVAVLAAFLALLGLVLVGLLPIGWLFSVSSTSLAFVVWLHLALWCLALSFGARFLRQALPELSSGAALLWLTLFCVVSFQVATFMRPVLWRAPGAPAIEHGKLFFIDHFSNVHFGDSSYAGTMNR